MTSWMALVGVAGAEIVLIRGRRCYGIVSWCIVVEVLRDGHARAGTASQNLSTNLMTLKTQAEVLPMFGGQAYYMSQ